MAYALKYFDGSAKVLNGRIAITRQDNDITQVRHGTGRLQHWFCLAR